ncbi:MAG: glycosyltransferase [Alphaproteobacteria bacterium]|nr:glycosyltransferase [Alphaproteobacteria bacterium]
MSAARDRYSKGLDQERMQAEEASELPSAIEGHIDFYGYHAASEGFFFCGWMTYPWPDGHRPEAIVACVGEEVIVPQSLATFYHREDVQGRGMGFVFFLQCPPQLRIALPFIEVRFPQTSYRIHPTPEAPCLEDAQLVEWLQGILTAGEEGSQRDQMQALLLGEAAGAVRKPPQSLSGFVDFYGHHSLANGWLLCGWVSDAWHEELRPESIRASFEEGEVTGEGIVVLYSRTDLTDGARGLVLYIEGPVRRLGALCSVSFDVPGAETVLSVGAGLQRLREPELNGRLRPILATAPLTPPRDILLALLSRQPFAGQDTLATLADRILLEVDEAIFCEPDGLVLIGWCLAKPGAIRDIRLRCGGLASSVKLDECVRLERPDVLAAVGVQQGYDDSRCGFIAFLSRAVSPDARIYLEVETQRRDVAFKTVPQPKLDGITAIKRMLGCFDVRFLDVSAAYDRVIGPAAERLNRARLRSKPAAGVVDYGALPAKPRFSVIVPLHGRLDFVEYQLGLLSAHAAAGGCEFIYVLDDPPKRREAQFLFESAYERFRVPFRALLLDRNEGYAPANNIGLRHAAGTYVAFVNSDVFPGTQDWLERLAARLEADATLGAVGPLLLFEDGSVQHQGMHFSRLAEFGGWFFGQHAAKGMQYSGGPGLRRCISITGACMLLPRTVAEELGGFDETYVIGDFEDSDLCLRLHRMGLACAVDPEVRLFHLERKSQTSAAVTWRMNLTLYNAWVHERRWAATIEAHPLHAGAGPMATVA